MLVAETELVLILVFETIVVFLTVWKTWQFVRSWVGEMGTWKGSIATVVLSDGLIYYGQVSCVESQTSRLTKIEQCD